MEQSQQDLERRQTQNQYYVSGGGDNFGYAQNNPLKTKNNVCKKFLHGESCVNNCEFSHDKSKIKVCNNWKQGNCTKGNQCNFEHPRQPQTQSCYFFQQGTCTKNPCDYLHIFTTCKNFDMGYCPLGPLCNKEHIQRKLCLNYMYGFCPQGPNCEFHHPPTMTQKDFEFTIPFLQYLENKNNIKAPKIFQCYNCKQYGHKSTTCEQKNQINAEKEILCGLCNQNHQIQNYCQQKQDLMQQISDYQAEQGEI